METRYGIVVIPAYEPNEKLIDYAEDLQESGFSHIIVVDDGSGIKYRPIFLKLEEAGVIVLRHMRNFGKGQALKTAFLFIKDRFSRTYPVITADGDGQHLVCDVVKMDEKMKEYPNRLILGVRDFSGKNVPFKSREGNRFSSKFFFLSTGMHCPDTQTGLRGIPASLLDFAIQTEGDRYDYEMNFLTDATKRIDFYYQPITTVYEDNNSSSHFRPIRDSLRIYARPVRFALSSLTSAGVDFAMFYLLTVILSCNPAVRIMAATVGARLCSGWINFKLNKHFSFKSKGSGVKEGARYTLLFIGQMLLSAGGVTLVSLLLPSVLAKLLVDGSLFVISYLIQKRWVFAKDENGGLYEKKKRTAVLDAHI